MSGIAYFVFMVGLTPCSLYQLATCHVRANARFRSHYSSWYCLQRLNCGRDNWLSTNGGSSKPKILRLTPDGSRTEINEVVWISDTFYSQWFYLLFTRRIMYEGQYRAGSFHFVNCIPLDRATTSCRGRYVEYIILWIPRSLCEITVRKARVPMPQWTVKKLRIGRARQHCSLLWRFAERRRSTVCEITEAANLETSWWERIRRRDIDEKRRSLTTVSALRWIIIV